ncbi:metallophosphoesterase family protein [Methanosphaerula palustris]|uniref:Metallophosphoesterase n=1 Tax=Methanosphaerula palustris (strain ATCC BAA-1556 / DSM 19958 / E1-9c) TaxID=521011 RepID=B8GI64_METPE|nr:metallophosphoesterase [Methanosphaerula palustris]ACL15415.1 metallophosphoesterase [Methanosphaerula palustris E1-9c]
MEERPVQARFAHLADLHIGAWRERMLSTLNMTAFAETISACILKRVDFVVIAGDLFDGNLPDLGVVREAVTHLKRLSDHGIRTYLTYGSHDYSPTGTSIIDILASAGLFCRVSPEGDHQTADGEGLRLPFVIDQPTGVKLTGIYGRKNGLEAALYQDLDRTWLEEEEGTKIFLFHSAISELQPVGKAFEEGVPLTLLPRGFAYYAGGHIHTRISVQMDGYGTIAYPGPLLGHQIQDLEALAAGASRGFFLVTLRGGEATSEFIPVHLPDVIVERVDADQKSPAEVTALLEEVQNSLDVAGAIVLLSVKGTLSSGAPHQVGFKEVRQHLEADGALVVKISRSNLRSPDKAEQMITGENRDEIERTIFAKSTATFSPDSKITDGKTRKILEFLTGENGVSTAVRLLAALEEEKREDERKDDFTLRIRRGVEPLLRHQEDR